MPLALINHNFHSPGDSSVEALIFWNLVSATIFAAEEETSSLFVQRVLVFRGYNFCSTVNLTCYKLSVFVENYATWSFVKSNFFSEILLNSIYQVRAHPFYSIRTREQLRPPKFFTSNEEDWIPSSPPPKYLPRSWRVCPGGKTCMYKHFGGAKDVTI